MNTGTRDGRLQALQDAFTRTTHCHQVLSNTGKAAGDPELFGAGGVSQENLKDLLAAGERLASTDPMLLRVWVDTGQEGAEILRAIQQLQEAPTPNTPKLPLNVFADWLARRAPGIDLPSRRALASLMQLSVHMVRDSDLLQDYLKVYVTLGLKVSLKTMGLPSSDAELLAYAQEVSAGCGKCPFDCSPLPWQMTFKKMELWGEKYYGRDKFTLAKELAEDPEVKVLLPKLARITPRKIAFFGHSMTMSLHWTNLGSWCDVAGEVVRLVNPRVEYHGYNQGGLTASRAVTLLLPALLCWRPNETYILMSVSTEDDRKALRKIAADLRKHGGQFHLVDEIRPFSDRPEEFAYYRQVCAEEGGVFLDFRHRHTRATDWQTWRPMGNDVHMYTPGHVFYAKELLKYWAGKVPV